MGKFDEYMAKAYTERMEGGDPTPIGSSKELSTGKGQSGTVATTYDLELAGNIIKGNINGNPVNISVQDFAKQYPDIAKGVLEVLKRDGAAHYAPDKQPPSDFVQNPQTKGQMVATKDV
jgi:hypothetical protein